jgi:hypothetical protein
MTTKPLPRISVTSGVFAALALGLGGFGSAGAQMVTGAKMPGYAEAFGLNPGQAATDYTVQEIAVKSGKSSMANVLLPGEAATFTFRFTNKTHSDIHTGGVVHLISYQTRTPVGEVWAPHVTKIADESDTPIQVDLPGGGTQDISITPRVNERFGGYALVADIPGHGRTFAAALVRSMKPDAGRVQYPTYALDATWPQYMNEGVLVLFEKLGVKGMRLAASYAPKDSPEYEGLERNLATYMKWTRDHDVTAMLTLDSGSMQTQPMGRPRSWLDSNGSMLKTKADQAWLPQYDADFQQWVQHISTQYGWPRGSVNAVELWNEPWESVSISGWQADIPRYQEIFTHMAQGVEAARKDAGVQVLIGGTCSSSNARDKLFADGSDKFLKWLDFVSVHYQALAADPSEVPEWMNRKNPLGPVKVWDTESWIANSEDRFPAIIASMRAQGQSRTAGIYGGNVYDSQNLKIDGKIIPIVQVWAPAAAVAATTKLIGQRDFNRLLFQNGLPWVFLFNGLPAAGSTTPNAEDGTIVVLGDLKQLYDPNRTVFRQIKIADNATMTLNNREHRFHAFDSNGNEMGHESDSLTVPLNGSGYFLRGDGRSGSFAALVEAAKNAKVVGMTPVEIVAHDLTARLDQKPALRLTVTNVLDHAVTADVTASLAGVTLATKQKQVSIAANESQDVLFPVTGGVETPGNTYALNVNVDAGVDGSATHQEDLHVDLIAHRTITVDGDLKDWAGILPQVLPGTGIGANMTEEAWLPFKDFSTGSANGLATVYLAYDEKNFYFAARIADDTVDPGMIRFANRKDDDYFYPDRAAGMDGTTLFWPSGVRHYSYRKHFDIPSGSGEHDNVQIAFNVLDKKPWLPNPPGVMPHFIMYWDTDYEYALNPVAKAYGGGTEIWRLQAPGIPRKHFFPRQPKSPIDGGPVTAGQLVIHHEHGTRIVEASIPWTELPDVWERVRAGKTVKFTARVSDNKGPAHELATGRSVSITNSITFHDDWKTHWANEIEFGVEPLNK